MSKEVNSVEFLKKYNGLNKSQKEAVDAIDGPVMVVAGPGTGKTTILSLRIAQILLKTDTKPENILALTFTNSGVVAMRKKLLEYIGDLAYRVNIFTFHSFSEHVIKEFSFYFKELQFSRVISDIEKIEIIEEIISNNSFKEIVYEHDIFGSISQIIRAINEIKKDGLNPDDFKLLIPKWEEDLMSDEKLYYKRKFGKFNAGDVKQSEKEKIDKKIKKAYEILTVFEEYQKIIKEKGFYDFSDMIINVLNELESNENLKLDLQENYQYLLVDEHQDTNFGQNKLIQLLTDAEHLDGRPNLFTVGDDKQSIYRFQGASLENFKFLDTVYKDVKKIALEENYRSSESILNSAHSLIINTSEDAVYLNSNSKEKNKVNLWEFSNYKFELLKLADDILEKINSGVDPNEIAIIYRSNKNVKEIKQVFNYKKIPHTIISNEYLLQDVNINNLINLLRVIYDPNDNYHLSKSFFTNFLNLDPFDVVNVLQQYSIYKRKFHYNLIDILDNEDFLKKSNVQNPSQFISFKNTIKYLKVLSENEDFDDFIKDFINKTGYLEFMLKSDDGQDQLLKLDKLFDEIKKQRQNNKNYSLEKFIKFIDSYHKYKIDIETNDPEIVSGVKLMTAHKSKGLEFEHVYIINTIRSAWEKQRGGNNISLPIENFKGDENDERRLFYVAMTRAKKDLTVSFSKQDWQGREQEKTQFINEIDDSFIDKNDMLEFEKNNLSNLDIFVRNNKEIKGIFEKDYLSNIFLNKNLSVTAINNYIDCPIKYLFKNLIQLPSVYNDHQIFGNTIHAALEEYFNDSVKNEKLLSKKELLDKFEKHITNSSISEQNFKRYKTKGEKILSDYYEEYNSEWSLNIETEKRIKETLNLDNGQKVTITGILDKIIYLDSPLEGPIDIVDYKTGKTYSLKNKSQKETLERQLIFYHLLMRNFNQGKYKVENAVLDFVEKNKKDEYEKFTVQVGDNKVNELIDSINKMATEVMSGEFLNNGCGKSDCEHCELFNRIK
jgi:DNA helicase II / ATP-dependent DNA helicase PcrA